MNFFAGKSDQFAFLICLSKRNGTEDYKVVIDIKIWQRTLFQQCLIVRVDIEKFSVDFYFRAGYNVAVENFIEVFENIIGRDITNVGRNAVGFGMDFESKKFKRQIHQKSPPYLR